jgi:hypothetical protein
MLRLSEAIRLGSMMVPQAFGGLIRYRYAPVFSVRGGPWQKEPPTTFADIDETEVRERTEPYAACALGAALLAVGADAVADAPKEWKKILHAKVPACSGKLPGLTVGSRIIYYNDGRRKSREEIADWVESVERGLGLWPEAPAEKAAPVEEVVSA